MAGFAQVNLTEARELASLVQLENVVQDLFVLDPRACNTSYTQDMNAISVSVARANMVVQGRKYGVNGLTNTGAFDNAEAAPTSDIYTIQLNNILDQVMHLSRVQNDASGLINLRNNLAAIVKSMVMAANAAYLAKLVSSNINAAITWSGAAGSRVATISEDYVTKEVTADGDEIAYNALMKASENLNKGDLENGFQLFPQEKSLVFASPEFFTKIQKSKHYVSQSNIGAMMFASGVNNPFNPEQKLNSFTGYRGDIGGMQVRTMSNFKELLAGKIGDGYLAQKTSAGAYTRVDTDALDQLEAIVVCGDSVLGGYLMGDIEVDPSNKGQGYLIKPYMRNGFEPLSAKGIQIITTATGFTATKLKNDGNTLEDIGPGNN